MSDQWNSDLAENYRVYREYVVHEDDLINHRSTWHHTLQGLLFAALGIVLQWKADPQADPHSRAIQRTLTILLPTLGIAMATAAFLSIRAATKALDRLGTEWRLIASTYPADVKPVLPSLTGAGDGWAIVWGKAPAYGIPVCIGIAWLVLLLVACVPFHK